MAFLSVIVFFSRRGNPENSLSLAAGPADHDGKRDWTVAPATRNFRGLTGSKHTVLKDLALVAVAVLLLYF